MNNNAINSFKDWLMEVTPDAIIATITAIAVIIIGDIIRWIYIRHKDATYLYDLRLLLCEHIKNTVKLIERRLTGFEELSKIAPSFKSDFIFKKVSITSDNIMLLPQVDLFRAIQKGNRKNRNNRISGFSKLIEVLNFLSTEATITENQFQYFFSHQNKYSEELKDYTNELIAIYREYLSENRKNGIKPADDPFIGKINQLVTVWSELKNKDDVENIISMLAKPIKQVCVDYQADTRRVKVISVINNIENAQSNLDRILTLFGEYFKEEIDLLKPRLGIIKDALTLLSRKI